LRDSYLAGNNTVLPGCDKADPFSPRFWPGRLETLARRRKPAGIFLVDMGDLFGPWVPAKWIEAILQVVKARPQHRWYLLTKNPARYEEFAPWPDNCWLGATITCQADWDERWQELENVEAAVRWVSVEPFLGEIDMVFSTLSGILPNWIVIGALTGCLAQQPYGWWVQGLTEQAERWGGKVFHKDNLALPEGIERRRQWPKV